LFTIETAPDGTIAFNGKGSGHGIGLCQVGAKALANPPFNYTFDQILAHYYPGTTLTTARGGG
jgi:stage II sporulation protein D